MALLSHFRAKLMRGVNIDTPLFFYFICNSEMEPERSDRLSCSAIFELHTVQNKSL